MNIAFLDFDGVLNTLGGFIMQEGVQDRLKDEFEYRKESKNFLYEYFKDTPIEYGLWDIYNLDINLVARLNRLVEECNLYFVISSAWRIGKSIDGLRAILCLTGFMYPYRIIDKTINESGIRGLEIHEWLNREDNKNKWYDYIIIDDETCDIEGYHDNKKIFKVETLTEKDVDKIIKYFKEGE